MSVMGTIWGTIGLASGSGGVPGIGDRGSDAHEVRSERAR